MLKAVPLRKGLASFGPFTAYYLRLESQRAWVA